MNGRKTPMNGKLKRMNEKQAGPEGSACKQLR